MATASSANLLAAYAPMVGAASTPAIDEIITTVLFPTGLLLAASAGSASCVRRSGASTLSAKSPSSSARSTSRVRA